MKKFYFVLILCLVAHLSQAQLLWEISGNGLEQPSYLFGTIHMIPKNDYFFTDAMQKAFDSSEQLVLEADMFNLSLADKLKLAGEMFLPQGTTLQDYMEAERYAAMRQLFADSLGIKAKKLDKKYSRIKPFFLSALLLQEYVGKTRTYEEELNQAAKKQGMLVQGLETVAYQMGLANSLSIEEQLEGMDDMASYRQYASLVAAYKQQDLNQLLQLSEEEYESEAGQAFMADFVHTRNADWVPKIEAFIKDRPTFIAVGALHLPGEKGVLDLLKGQGYTVKPLGEI